MDHPKASLGHLPIIAAISLALALALVCGLFGQRGWSHQTSLTNNFEACMEAAPFKQPLSQSKMEAAVTPESLPRHFEEFDQIFRDTGLPPIWDGSKLVPWTVFHKQSILLQSSATNNLGSFVHRTS